MAKRKDLNGYLNNEISLYNYLYSLIEIKMELSKEEKELILLALGKLTVDDLSSDQSDILFELIEKLEN